VLASPAVAGPAHLISFSLDGRPCAIDAAAVIEILAAVAIRPLPGQPAYVAGVIDLRGTIVPVVDLHVRFGSRPRPLELSDRFIVVHAGDRIVTLWVDEVADLIDAAELIVSPSSGLMAGDRSLAGIATSPAGVLTIHDVAAFVEQCEADAVFAAVGA
jgi:purine-binding chemotaxis protein CheW